jgi:hypothetical protein
MDTVDRDETSAKPAARQRPDKKKVMRARPVKGAIDHAALSREHIARFPKILAALAKYERG